VCEVFTKKIFTDCAIILCAACQAQALGWWSTVHRSSSEVTFWENIATIAEK